MEGAPVLEVVERQQQLRRSQPVPPEQLGPESRQRDLADRGGGLGIGEAAAPALVEPERRGAQRDRARGDHHDILPTRPRAGDLGDETLEPRLAQPLRADQQRRADLDHKARADAGIGEMEQAGDLHRRAISEAARQ